MRPKTDWAKRIRGLGLVIALMVGLALGWDSLSRREKVPDAPNSVSAPAPRVVALPRPRAMSETKSVATDNAEASPACRRFWDELQEVRLEHLEDKPEALMSLPRAGDCRNVPTQLRFWDERFRATCGRLTADNFERGQSAQECFASFSTYRAYVSDWLTRKVPLAEIDDTRVLADKLMVAYLSPGGAADSRGVTPLAAIASRMLDRNPRSVSAAKAFLSALGDEGKTKWSERLWRRADRALEIVVSSNRELPGARAVARWVRSRGEAGADVPGTVLQRLGGFSFLDFYSERR